MVGAASSTFVTCPPDSLPVCSVGDWGVVNSKPRAATCVAVGDAELLCIAAFNFRATVDQMLLARLIEVVGEKREGKCSRSFAS